MTHTSILTRWSIWSVSFLAILPLIGLLTLILIVPDALPPWGWLMLAGCWPLVLAAVVSLFVERRFVRPMQILSAELKRRDRPSHQHQTRSIEAERLAAFAALATGIAQEIKNPLAGILGCAQISLLEFNEQERVRNNLELIEKEAQRCRYIIDDLLRFARDEKAVLEPTRVNQLVEDAVAAIRHHLEVNQVSLRRELASDLPPIRGNANQLQQVLMNLMINAQQAIGDEGGTVSLATLDHDGSVIITVSDTGPGMNDDVAAKIFEPFFTTKPAGQGTGLGLSVTYGIIQDHGGDISVTRADSGGAKFVITLPVENEEAIPLEHAS